MSHRTVDPPDPAYNASPRLTDEPNNPPDQPEPTPPGNALQIARIVIALGLCVGVAGFGVYAFDELTNRPAGPGLANNFGTSSDIQTPSEPAGKSTADQLKSMAQRDPNKYITIFRQNPEDSPHPGMIPPYKGTAAFQQPPYRQPDIGNEIWEQCNYSLKDAEIEAVFMYYDKQAVDRGLKLRSRQPTSAAAPGGIEAVWSDGSHRLDLTVWPEKNTEPTQPPFKPKNPLKWVVRYIYPKDSTPRGVVR